MNGEPQDSTTASLRPYVDGIRSSSEQNISNEFLGGTYIGPRVEPRVEYGDGELARRRIVSNQATPTYNPVSAPTGPYEQYPNPAQFQVPPRIDSLGSHHAQAREEAARRAMLMMVQHRRAQAESAAAGRQRATDATLPPSPSGLPRRHANSLSTSATYRRPILETPIVEQRNPIYHRQSDFQPVDNQPNGYIVPRWQPDGEVSSCPICKTPFSFFYRKHHCRKCGRVVCGNCSPHRITIPRQHIVNPPAVHPIEIDLTGDSSQNEDTTARLAADQIYPAFGGGQEVRLCNPCVPDPHPLSPPSYPTVSSTFGQPSQPRRMPSEYYQSARRRSHHGGGASFDYNRYHGSNATSMHGNRNAQQLQPNPLNHIPTTPFGSAPDSASMHMPPRYGYPRSHRPHASLSVLPNSRYRTMFEAMTTPEAPPLPPTALEEPSRQIPEEDECPICHEELPPKGPDGSEVEREAHVTHCIEVHFSSSRPRNGSMPDPAIAVAAPVAASSATPGQAGSYVSSSSLPGPSVRRRTTGMVVYNATEKDCIGEDGATQECIICFEDFEPGTEMGRLECLCKFHKACENNTQLNYDPNFCRSALEVGGIQRVLEHVLCIKVD